MIGVDLLVTLVLTKHLFVQALIADLGADDFARRERASLLLHRLGPLPYSDLRAATRHDDLEIRRRSERLVASIWRHAFRPAAERHALIYSTNPNSTDCFLGVVVVGDGKEAFVLTTIQVLLTFKDGAEVEWRKKRYRLCFEKMDNQEGLCLASFRCDKKWPLLRLPDGRSTPSWLKKVHWWNTQVRDGTRKDCLLPSRAGEDTGGCVFVLDEESLLSTLAGVDVGQVPDKNDGRFYFADPSIIRRFLDHTPGIDLPGK